MVQVGGVMTGAFLIAVLIATWYLRHTETDRRLYGHAPVTALLVVSTAAILALGIYTIVLTLGIYRVG